MMTMIRVLLGMLSDVFLMMELTQMPLDRLFTLSAGSNLLKELKFLRFLSGENVRVREIRFKKSSLLLIREKLVAQASFSPAVKRSSSDSSPPILIIDL